MSIPDDPFIPDEAQEMMGNLNIMYVAALRAGFPEQRAFELINNLFITQMATLQAIILGNNEKEG